MESIIQNGKFCAKCDCEYGLHKHHVFGGANRNISEKNGFVVYLCGEHHNFSNEGVHFNRELDLYFKRKCQEKYEETHTRHEFIKLIGRNYIWDDDKGGEALQCNGEVTECNETVTKQGVTNVTDVTLQSLQSNVEYRGKIIGIKIYLKS